MVIIVGVSWLAVLLALPSPLHDLVGLGTDANYDQLAGIHLFFLLIDVSCKMYAIKDK